MGDGTQEVVERSLFIKAVRRGLLPCCPESKTEIKATFLCAGGLTFSGLIAES